VGKRAFLKFVQYSRSVPNLGLENVKCPECGSDRIGKKSSVKEFNPEDLLVCTKCMCHFKIFRSGRNFKALNKWLEKIRKYKQRLKRKKKRRKKKKK